MRSRGVLPSAVNESIHSLILREADLLAREKCLSPHIIFSCLEKAFERIAKSAYGETHDIRAVVNKNNGSVAITRHIKVVEEVTDPNREISLSDAVDAALGDDLVDELPMPSFNRIVIQNFKTALTKNISDIEREMQYNEFKDREGQIVSGLVKRVEGGNLILDIGRSEGIIFRNELIPRESYRVNDRVKCYIYAVKREVRGPQVFLSRTHPGFLAKLFAQEVPQIYDGLIEIKAVAREAGSRAKVAITTPREDRSFDPIGACVGVRGSRVNAVSQELQGEKIDIIPWSSDLPVFVVNALTPAEVVKVVVENLTHIKVVVPDHQQSIAIGRRGQNVKLAHQLTGVSIEIVTETIENQQRVHLRQYLIDLFMNKLDLDEMMAQLLVSEGFESIQELSQASLRELSDLEGVTADIAAELKERADEALQEEKDEMTQKFVSIGGDLSLVELGIPPQILENLGAGKIFSSKQFADLSLDELGDILGKQKELLPQESWGELILKARLND